mmetsp:Transcript_11911/g.33561  ORF Transcript_11911/g.33561 Transcript_11911/m.33561 type:complete len:301 (+) Transcript_11911:382-1284(+)
MPRCWLLRTMIFTSRSCAVSVASSCGFIMKEPSPSMSTTVSLGRPSFPSNAAAQPSADGRPKPIEPRPPEVTHRRTLLNLYHWALHIWCCPTPVEMMASPFVSRCRVSMAICGRMRSPLLSYAMGLSSRLAATMARHGAYWSRSGAASVRSTRFRAPNEDLASLHTEMSTTLFLPISAASMSMCTILDLGAKAASLPVTRSSKRTPTAMSRSLSSTAKLAYTVPCMPSICRASGWDSGKAPSPINVCTTGTPVSSTSSRSSSAASRQPPPTYSTGRSASPRASAMARMSSSCGGGARREM